MNSQDNDQPDKPSKESMEDSESSVKEKREPDQFDIMEITDVRVDQEREKIADRRFDRELKGKYANKLFYFLVSYTLIVILIIFLQGFQFCKFSLHYVALSLLISSIAVMAIGVGRFVVRSLGLRK